MLYLEIKKESIDGKRHEVSFKLSVYDEICINTLGEEETEVELIDLGNLHSAKIGSKAQRVLCQSGDDVRINWGYFYLTATGTVTASTGTLGENSTPCNFVQADVDIKDSTLITFAYDDISSIEYFGEHLKAYWKKDGKKSYGFIAQEVEPIVPEMVSSINDTLRLEYNQLHAFEIGAIQHIDSEVETLKKDLKTANAKLYIINAQKIAEYLASNNISGELAISIDANCICFEGKRYIYSIGY